MKYSVVMPFLVKNKEHAEVYNQTIKSILENSHDFEFIGIDDGSSYQVNMIDFKKIIVHPKNLGIAPSWNDGIRVARGKYIAIINDDIVVQEGYLDAMAKCFEEHADCGVSAPSVEHLPDLSSGIHEKKTWFPGSCFMISQGIKSIVGEFDEQFVPFNCEDIDYWERIYQNGFKMYRNFDSFVRHKEGDVLHTLDYKKVDSENVKKLLAKWGYDPRPKFYE